MMWSVSEEAAQPALLLGCGRSQGSPGVQVFIIERDQRASCLHSHSGIHRIGSTQAMLCSQPQRLLRQCVIKRPERHVGELAQCRGKNLRLCRVATRPAQSPSNFRKDQIGHDDG